MLPSRGRLCLVLLRVDSTKVRNGKRKGQGNGKNGQPYLAWAYAAAAHCAIRVPPSVQRSYQRKQTKTTVPVAHQTVAPKLARACDHLMRHHVPFEAAKAFGSPPVQRVDGGARLAGGMGQNPPH